MTNQVIAKATKATKATKAPKTVELSEAGAKALATFRKAKEAETKAKALKAQAEAILNAELGGSLEGMVGGIVAVKVIASKNSHFNRKKLLELYPEAYSATYEETEYTYLKTL
jgi:hypothetical protein